MKCYWNFKKISLLYIPRNNRKKKIRKCCSDGRKTPSRIRSANERIQRLKEKLFRRAISKKEKPTHTKSKEQRGRKIFFSGIRTETRPEILHPSADSIHNPREVEGHRRFRGQSRGRSISITRTVGRSLPRTDLRKSPAQPRGKVERIPDEDR